MAKTLKITRWPPRKRRPVTNDSRAVPTAVEIGGDGAMPTNATSATTNVATSVAYALVRPKLPMSTPATAGPAIQPNVV